MIELHDAHVITRWHYERKLDGERLDEDLKERAAFESRDDVVKERALFSLQWSELEDIGDDELELERLNRVAPAKTLSDSDDRKNRAQVLKQRNKEAMTKPLNGDTNQQALNGVAKRWTPEFTSEVQAYRDKHGPTKTAKKYGVDISLITRHTKRKSKLASLREGVGKATFVTGLGAEVKRGSK